MASIARLVNQETNWDLAMGQNTLEGWRAIRAWKKADGVIGVLTSPQLARDIGRSRIPVVSLSPELMERRFAHVHVDNQAVGDVAAQHLLAQGFRNFGFVQWPSPSWATDRQRGFAARIRAAGGECSAFAPPPATRRRPRLPLRDWLRALPKPVGILCSDDWLGRHVATECRTVGLRVPEDVTLIGVGDSLYCEMATPPLSSVRVPWDRIGREAVALMTRLLRGATPPRRPVLLPPEGVTVRRSSDFVAAPDPQVAAALRFIREHADEPFRIKHVAAAIRGSRRSIERKFRAHLNRSVGEEITAVHINRAKDLLESTTLPIGTVAAMAGFGSGKRCATVFRRVAAISPAQYRKLHLKAQATLKHDYARD